jgi:hypothetical protein
VYWNYLITYTTKVLIPIKLVLKIVQEFLPLTGVRCYSGPTPTSLPTSIISIYCVIFFLYTVKYPCLKKNPAKPKKRFYQVADPFLRLWFGTIFPYESFLEFGQIETVIARNGEKWGQTRLIYSWSLFLEQINRVWPSILFNDQKGNLNSENTYF